MKQLLIVAKELISPIEISSDVIPRVGEYLDLIDAGILKLCRVDNVEHVVTRSSIRSNQVIKETRLICSVVPANAPKPWVHGAAPLNKEPQKDSSIDDQRLELLYKVLKFSSGREISPIEQMIAKRGGKLDVRHCKCGKEAHKVSKVLHECLSCYTKRSGK